MQQELGKIIKKYRKEKNFTITQLSEKLNISTGLLSNIERGKTDTFQLTLLNKIIYELNIPISELNLFSLSCSFEDLKLYMPANSKKVKSALEKLLNSFIEASSTLSFDENKISLLTELLENQLNILKTLIEVAKSK